MASDGGTGRDLTLSIRLLWGSSERRSRGPKPALSVDRIVRAAIEVADAEGLAALSMRKVADRLGVGTMSLYRYVPGKDELLDLMLDAVLPDPATLAQEPGEWRARLESFARAAWRLFHEHPWMLLASQRHPVMGPREMAGLESLLAAVAGIGLDEHETMGVIFTVDGYVRGVARSSVDAMEAERRTGVTTDQWWTAQGEALHDLFTDQSYPMIAKVSEAGVWDQHEDAWFEFGLARVLDGIEQLVRARTRPDPTPEVPA
jgi:AcrR family transcriptional regulator